MRVSGDSSSNLSFHSRFEASYSSDILDEKKDGEQIS